MTKIINQDTLVPLGLAIAIIGSVAAWACDIHAKVNNYETVITDIKKNNEFNVKLIYEINSRLSRIEWKLEEKK
jgi:hypothetical protein